MSARVAVGLAAALVVAIGWAGCGSTGRGSLSNADAARLRADIAAARTAASRHQGQQAASKLVAFRQLVARLAAQHKLTTAQEQALQTGAQQAQARIALDVKPASTPSPTTVTTTSSAPPSPAPAAQSPPAPPGKAKGHDKHPGKDKHGGGKGDGGG